MTTIDKQNLTHEMHTTIDDLIIKLFNKLSPNDLRIDPKKYYKLVNDLEICKSLIERGWNPNVL